MSVERRAALTDLETAMFLRAVGRRIRMARLSQELTQEQLATAAGISRSFVSLIEKGTHGVDVVRLYRLAAVLGTSLPELLTLPPQPRDAGPAFSVSGAERGVRR